MSTRHHSVTNYFYVCYYSSFVSCRSILSVYCHSLPSDFRYTHHGSIPLYKRSISTQHLSTNLFINISCHLAVPPAATYWEKISIFPTFLVGRIHECPHHGSWAPS